jgi:hypothetical protein
MQKQVCDLENSLAGFGDLNGKFHSSQLLQGLKVPNNSLILAK